MNMGIVSPTSMPIFRIGILSLKPQNAVTLAKCSMVYKKYTGFANLIGIVSRVNVDFSGGAVS